ncbi:hypothetical protein DXG01_013498 [Tephrocybe rancida]|nr:hypothetical protein DXG01_013498 [Tephrocybe rancida]
MKLATLAHSKDATVLVPRNPDTSVEFRANTYGARAECRSLNPLCLRESDMVKNCTNVGIPEMPFDTSGLFIFNEQKTSIILACVDDLVVGDFYGVYRVSGKVPQAPFSTYLQF